MEKMKRSGIADLPLHGGKAPAWLVSRMIKLARSVILVMLDDFEKDELLKRLSNPYWFQALSCILGYDWHSSGTTTVTVGVLKSVFSKYDFGLAVAGGKGLVSRNTPKELIEIGNKFKFTEEMTDNLVTISKLVAKVDNTALQDGFQLYHHSFFVTSEGNWAVIQQGMDPIKRYARRYHWLSFTAGDLINEPHNAIKSEIIRDKVLNLTARKSEETRKVIVDLIVDNPNEIKSAYYNLIDPKQTHLFEDKLELDIKKLNEIPYLYLPKKFNWKVLDELSKLTPAEFKEVLLFKGVGPSMLRSLSLIALLIWGTPISWEDPAKFSFAHGGKDGIPYPVNVKMMENVATYLQNALDRAKLGDKERINALKRLSKFFSETKF